MSNDETVKLITETLQGALNEHIGDRVDDRTICVIQNHMEEVLHSLLAQLGISAPLPKIDVVVHGPEAMIDIRDPKNGEQITVSQWISRATEGFYD